MSFSRHTHIHFIYCFDDDICDKFTNWFMHFLVTSTKHRIYTFLFYTTCGESLLQIGAVELLQFCRGARALLTILQLNARTICSAYQLMSPKISHFNRYLNLIVITRIFLLNIKDADILFGCIYIICQKFYKFFRASREVF